jgi:hypothetical protein
MRHPASHLPFVPAFSACAGGTWTFAVTSSASEKPSQGRSVTFPSTLTCTPGLCDWSRPPMPPPHSSRLSGIVAACRMHLDLSSWVKSGGGARSCGTTAPQRIRIPTSRCVRRSAASYRMKGVGRLIIASRTSMRCMATVSSGSRAGSKNWRSRLSAQVWSVPPRIRQVKSVMM